MTPAQIIRIVVAVAVIGLSWAVRFEYDGKRAAEKSLSDYQAQQKQAVDDKKAQDAKDAAAAAQKAKDAEVQRANDAKDHQSIVDTLTARVRSLQSALNGRPLPGPMENPFPVQGGSAGAGQAGGSQPPTGDLAQAVADASSACLATYDDERAIIRTEPSQ